MTHLSSLLLVFIAALAMVSVPTSVRAEVYELRTYTTHEGKLPNLNTRFREHTTKLFEKHGMTNVGYWVPADAPRSENTLIYVLKHDSREAAAESWKAFLADPEWKKVAQESQVDGPILAKAPESVFMETTDYSPKLADVGADKDSSAVFELRTYRTNEGKLSNLDARFRDHTMRIFQRHGMTNVAYWHPTDKPACDDTLIYILKHGSREAAKASWDAFRADEEWQKVAKESQKDGKFLREPPESVYMNPTDYSKIR